MLVRLFALLLLVMLPMEGALAHGALERANPKAGSVLKAAPAQVKLRFSEKLEVKFTTVEITDAAGQRVEAGPAQAEGNNVEVPLKPLAPGTYTVSWRVVSVDTHTTSGRFSFELRP